jgi:site-specific recombinase XerC
MIVTPISAQTCRMISRTLRRTLVDEWVSIFGLDMREYGTHSMRRTKASLTYKATGNLRAVQILLGHTNIENTVRYLGIDVDDALTLSERAEI